MGERPAGTLTFLFTDIEGSTRRWQLRPAAMPAALARHDSLLADAVEGSGGRIFKHTGDGVCAAFGAPAQAVAAAVEAQRRLLADGFADVDGLPVRVAVHTGACEERDGDYFGPALNRVARVVDVAHGGQILVSGATAALLVDDDVGVTLDDLGEHRLRDLAHRERLFQVIADGLPRRFPPPRTGDHGRAVLPVMRTSFVGRDEEVETLQGEVVDRRLVTLVGIGGTGKTRLAVEVGRHVAPRFDGGVYFVDLAPLADGELILAAVAGALDLEGGPGVGSMEEVVLGTLAKRHTLLVVDNCEHLLDDVAALVDTLLDRCPAVHVLATSREPLALEGEHVWQVSSLPSSHAVELFRDRATAADARFRLTPENEAAVLEVCNRLDGIPLAIELAAARASHLSPVDLAARLDDRFRLLTGGRRRRAPRQQTLQGAIDWSHDLLSPDEQRLLRRLAVFGGAFTLDAAVAVCGDDGAPSTVELLGSLTAKSLVSSSPADVTRLRLLETIRLYANERLVDSGESDTIRRRHAEWWVERLTAFPLDVRLLSMTMEWLMDEVDDVRAALDWAESAEPRLAVTLTTSVGSVWAFGGHHEEGARRLSALLDDDRLGDGDRAACLAILGFLHMVTGDFVAMDAVSRRSLELDPTGALAPLAWSYVALMCIFDPTRYDEGRRAIVSGLEAGGHGGGGLFDDLLRATEAMFLLVEGDLDGVIARAEAMPYAPSLGDANMRLAGTVAHLLAGAPERALAQADIGVSSPAGSHMLALRAVALVEVGDREAAVDVAMAAVDEHVERGIPLTVGDCLIAFAALALDEGDAERTTSLLETVWSERRLASFRSPAAFAVWRWYRRRAQALLDDDTVRRARATGAADDPLDALRREAERHRASQDSNGS